MILSFRFKTPQYQSAQRKGFMLEFFAYETYGPCIGHTAGLAWADFS